MDYVGPSQDLNPALSVSRAECLLPMQCHEAQLLQAFWGSGEVMLYFFPLGSHGNKAKPWVAED